MVYTVFYKSGGINATITGSPALHSEILQNHQYARVLISYNDGTYISGRRFLNLLKKEGLPTKVNTLRSVTLWNDNGVHIVEGINVLLSLDILGTL